MDVILIISSLGLMFKICSSIENWLLADENNLAAVHCLTGKGRTGTVIACYLAWIGQFPNALESLEYVAERRNSSVEKLTIPSQRRCDLAVAFSPCCLITDLV